MCEPCSVRNKAERAFYFCQNCSERYCKACSESHKTQKSSREHEIVTFDDTIQDTNKCEPCSARNTSVESTRCCQECKEYLCDSCAIEHLSHKMNKSHTIIQTQKVLNCDPCSVSSKIRTAVRSCLDCKEPLCATCAHTHLTMKISKHHRLTDIVSLNSSSQTELHEITELSCLKITPDGLQNSKKMREKPGKPRVTDNKSDRIDLNWEHDKTLRIGESYQIKFKSIEVGKWKVFSPQDPCRSKSVAVTGLKAETSYIFKVRVIDEITSDEGPFSPESDSITTGESPALKIKRDSAFSKRGPPDVYALPIIENFEARNGPAQTRKFTLGSPGLKTEEKTIMILGATGSGKSTLINTMANYVMGVTWEDPFRFTLVNLEKNEQIKKGNEALSQTEWITCYKIHDTVSSRINYTINLIDTPGFGDTRGLTQDAKIVSQIRELFTATSEKGVTDIDAVCFILKAPDARLTTTQKYIFESILALFGKDIVDNICSLITFADGQTPPVLDGLKELSGQPLPYKEYFTFNNSALFVNNSKENQSSNSSFFWELGIKSCENFFSKIQLLERKSLVLTSEVLTKRQQLENVISHLHREIKDGLIKINSIETQVDIFTKYESQIKANKEFKYTVEETHVEQVDISGKGIHTTTCMVCNFTCHNNCALPDNKDKSRCCAMSEGSCTVCPKKCHWQEHKNVAFIYEHRTEKVTKTYGEMLAKYQEASENKLTQGQLIQKMNNDIVTCEIGIQVMIEEITEHTNKLKDIALRPDPLSTIEYIELMILNEEREMESGYELRLQTLENCKKNAQYGESYQIFSDRLQATRSYIKQNSHQEVRGFIKLAKQKFRSLFS